jgi:hypothetical protein
MGTVFVFEPDADYGRVDVIRKAGRMPVRGLKFVASVTGRWKLVKVVDFDSVEANLAGQLDLVSGADENAIVLGKSKIRRSTYRDHTALVRIDVDADADLDTLRTAIARETGTFDDEDPESGEVDVVMGDFDMLAVVVDDDEGSIGSRIREIRKIDGVTRTESLRVIDYVSTSAGARDVEGDHYVDPFGD